MAAKKKPAGDYKVGFARPPAEHRYPKGKSGNPAGAPKKQKQRPVDVAEILNQPISITTGDTRQNMPAFEANVRQLVRRGLVDKNPNAILEFLKLCETYGVMKPPTVKEGGVLQAPRGVDFQEWCKSIKESVRPSSPDGDDDDID